VTEAAKAVGVHERITVPVRSLDACVTLLRRRDVSVRRHHGVGDLGGYRPLNVPMTQMIQSGTFYHGVRRRARAVPAEGWNARLASMRSSSSRPIARTSV